MNELEEPPLGALIGILVSLLLGGCFSLIEGAFIASRKHRFHSLAETGAKRYTRALGLFEEPPRVLLTLRFWITLLFFAAARGGWGLHPYLKRILGGWTGSPGAGEVFAIILIVGGGGLGLFFLGDLLPRQLALLAPEGIVAAAFPPLRLFMTLTSPVTWLASRYLGGLLTLLGIDKRTDAPITEDELLLALREGEKSGAVERGERSMVEGVFYLGDRPVETFMTHRSELEWLDINAEPGEAREAAMNTRRQFFFPVVTGTVDTVVGVVSARDILHSLLEEPWGGLKSIMRPPHFVPKSMSALRAFASFKRDDTEFLCVIDEYGGFAGALAQRNLVEEIVGELSGPSQEESGLLRQEDGSYLADGSVNIDDLAKVLAIEDLLGDHPEYHTLAGFILNLAEEVPRTGAAFDWRGFRFTILDMDGNRIDKLLIQVLPQENAGSGP